MPAKQTVPTWDPPCQYWKLTVPYDSALVDVGQVAACVPCEAQDLANVKGQKTAKLNTAVDFGDELLEDGGQPASKIAHGIGLYFEDVFVDNCPEFYLELRFMDEDVGDFHETLLASNPNHSPILTFHDHDLGVDATAPGKPNTVYVWKEARFVIYLPPRTTARQCEAVLYSTSKQFKTCVHDFQQAQENSQQPRILVVQLVFRMLQQILQGYDQYIHDSRLGLWSQVQKLIGTSNATDQIEKERLTGKLHQLYYFGLVRRLNGLNEAVDHMRPLCEQGTSPEEKASLTKKWKQMSRKAAIQVQAARALKEDAKDLSSMVVNLINLKEMHTSARTAKSTQLLAFLVLLFTPPALISAVFGMNVREFSGDVKPSIWLPIAIAAGTQLVTCSTVVCVQHWREIQNIIKGLVAG